MSDRIRNITAAVVIGLSLLVVVIALVADSEASGDRVEYLASRLKCPVCTSESIADSPAQVSRDLHVLIAEQVDDGLSDDQIIAFFVDRYGEEVLLDPPPSSTTWALWMAPLVAVAVGGAAIAGRLNTGGRTPTPEEHSAVEQALDGPS